MESTPERLPLGVVRIRTDQRSRTTRLGNPSRPSKTTRHSRSIRLGIFLYILAHNKCSDQQREYVAHFQGRLNLAEVQKALKFMHTLTTDPRTRARMQVDSLSIPTSMTRPKSREQRRIGVGYRDKGSLRSPHRPVLPQEVSLGVESTALDWADEPSWIRLGERKSQDEVMSEWRRNPLQPQVPSNHVLSSEEQWAELVERYLPTQNTLPTPRRED